MVKCDKCAKNITKTNPGLECNRCEKMVHLNSSCSGLSTKQRAALKAADNLEWACPDCLENSPRRNSVYIPPNDEDDEEGDLDNITDKNRKNVQIDVKQLLKDISKEMEKAIHKELGEMTKALEYQSDKMDEITESIDAFKLKIQELQKKNTELHNKNNYLEIRVGALEQRLKVIEQTNINNQLEIGNVPYSKTEILPSIVAKIAEKLTMSTSNVLSSKRLLGKNEKPGTIVIKFKNDAAPADWISAAKKNRLLACDLIDNLQEPIANYPVYIREALSYHNKKLLWETKQQLKANFMYIWCKGGVIRVRKDENAEIIVIRCEEDIKKIVKQVK